MTQKIQSGSEVKESFGNGYSLKYFKALTIWFIPVSLLEIIFSFLTQSLQFAIGGDSVSVHNAYLSVQLQMGITILNILLIFAATLLILTEKKKLFVWVFLIKYPLILMGQGLVLLAANADFPADPSRLTGYLGSIVFFLFFYVPHFIYLVPRISKPKTVSRAA